ncbi:MAG: lytic murein transglycosylase [Thermodesulfobacteriota bacterium]
MSRRGLVGGLVTFVLLAGLGSGMAVEGRKAADLVTDGQAIDTGQARYRTLFAELASEHGFAQEELGRLFAGLTIRKRVLELMDTQWEAKPYHIYRPRLVNDAVIEEGRQMLERHRQLLDRVEEAFHVERQVLVAIWGVETRYGRNEGAFDVFQTLNTLFAAYPRRSEFYRKELIDFLVLCRDNGIDPRGIQGSYGGAFGQTQFIPSSFRTYAVDFNGDGRRDVWRSPEDVLASIANYLSRAGWHFGAPLFWELGEELKDARLEEAYRRGRAGLVPWRTVQAAQAVGMPAPPGEAQLTVVGLELAGGGMRYVAGYPNFQAITAWNHSNRYAMVVSELAALLVASP